MPESRRRYPSDLSDAEWALLAPLLPPPRPIGRPRTRSDRLIAHAILRAAKRLRVAKAAAGVPAMAYRDVRGLALAACVHAADAQDREEARLLVERMVPNRPPSLQVVWADRGYTGALSRRPSKDHEQ